MLAAKGSVWIIAILLAVLVAAAASTVHVCGFGGSGVGFLSLLRPGDFYDPP